MDNRYVIIMAGGVGSRFWPLSRRERPKQFLDILGNRRNSYSADIQKVQIQSARKRIFMLSPVQSIRILLQNSLKLIRPIFLESLSGGTLLHVLPMAHSGY